MFASTAILPKRCKQISPRCKLLLSLCLMLMAAPWRGAAQKDQSSLEIYANAMKQPQVAEQISGLDKYLTMAGSSVLKQDALEVLIWDYTRMGSIGHAQQRAAELMQLDPGNPVAIAALGQQNQPPQKGGGRDAGRDRIKSAQAALAAMERLRQPEGMLRGDFAALRRHVESSLNGMLGLAYVDRQEYQLARTPLQQASAVAPENPQYAYALGLALLYSKDADAQNAYLYLARAANLTQGTAAGQQIGEFARNEYHKAGGNDADWSRFLAAAVVPERGRSQPRVVASSSLSASAARSSSPATVANNPVAPAAPAAAANSASAARPATTAKLSPPSLPPSSIPPRLQPPETGSSGITPAKPNEVGAPYAPVSLGILIETALLTKQNRPVILAALRDLISHLRGEDEAAILVFSNQLDFEQDLTANDQLLEQAINGLRPRRGRALLDGIAFAAGHLKRIGKNPNRVLLVVSDGHSENISRDAIPLSSQVSGVRVDCIGLHADGQDERALLERVASYSGGQARFASDPQQFRLLASQMTGFLGVRPH
jgi:tetratricopeptide (TPR) repeat protein